VDVNLYSRDNDLDDQALGEGLSLFKRGPFEIMALRRTKGFGVVNDLPPMSRSSLCVG